ncbi:glycosyltransferase [Microbacterium cremeum]|uniref:glycosyltransferase n=1 Tax=Microbacterium cremeum TaxID=2782169 RepID=UPI001E325B39|nr:glycosyltransferase [Microbacterium cremeum]
MHRITAKVLRRPLPVLPSPATGSSPLAHPGDPEPFADLTCALATDGLEIGGIGFVIEELAVRLPAAKVHPVVVCRGEGPRAARLRADGIEVRPVATSGEAAAALRDVDVIALHSAPAFVETAAIESGLPLVTAMHNTEIHFTRRRWTAFRALIRRSEVGVAVSETVREFHARHVPGPDARRFRVVPNGVPGSAPATDGDRAAARDALAGVLGVPLGDDIVFVCLARYDSQKNVAGTVASFVYALENGLAGVRFVFAGDPSDWVEVRRADAIRRCSPQGDRVHLLANSHARTLLLAADAFLLNSFFEGWAVAATEAAATGLPLVLSEVGGGAELVSFDATRSVLIPNAVGEAAAVTDARVRAARRRSRRQSNRGAFAEALSVVAHRVRADPTRRVPPAILTSVADMVQGHAAAIRLAGARRTQPEIRPSRTPPP